MRLLTFVLFFLFSMHVMASEPILYANVRSYHRFQKEEALNLKGNYFIHEFPLKKYRFIIYGYDLKQFNSSKLSKINNLTDYKLNITADLILLSFNKQNGLFKFKLELNNPWLEYIGNDNYLIAVGGKNIDGAISLLDGRPPIFIISGRYENFNNQHKLVNFGNNENFEIEFLLSRLTKDILLKLTHDFPIMVVSK